MSPRAYLFGALVACGARSELGGGAGGLAGEGGAATSASSEVSTTAVTTGTGGGVPSCIALEVSGPPITHLPTPERHGSRPTLVVAGEGLVSVVFSHQEVGVPSAPPSDAVSATFAPWGEWPDTLGEVARAVPFAGDPFGGESFGVARGPLGTGPGFSVLFYLPTGAFPSDMMLVSAEAWVDHSEFPPGIAWDAWEPGWPVALARGSASHLAAYQIGMGLDAFLTLAVVDESGPNVISDVACANAPFQGEVIATTDGYLVATAAGRPFGACPLDDGVPGPPKDIHVIHLDDATLALSLGAELGDIDPVHRMALVPRDGGAWLVWQHDGASNVTPPAIQIVRLDPRGVVDGPVFSVPSSTGMLGPLAAAALGNLVAVAWIDALDPSFRTIRLEVFDQNGAAVIETSMPTAPGWLHGESLALLSSSDQLLLAWADQEDSQAARVRVARFSCVAP